MARSCEQALAVGVPSVAFTDHLDFTTWTDGDRISTENLDPHRYSRMHLLDVDGYLATIEDCRQRYPDLRIFSGVEIGEAHMWAASARALVAGAKFERILGSLHAIPFDGRLTAADDLFRQLPAEEVMRQVPRRGRPTGRGQRPVPGAGAPGLSPADVAMDGRSVCRSGPSRPSTGPSCAPWPGIYRVLEVNTKSPLVSTELVRWWREAGGRAVSFGSDAHQPWRVGDKFKLAVDIVEAAGFKPGRDRFDFWRI